jgi:hypothetical protein
VNDDTVERPLVAPSSPPSLPALDLDGLEWQRTYERTAIDDYVVEVRTERARLLAEIADAERRTAAARERTAARRAAGDGELSALVLEAKAELDRIDREHQEAVAAIRADAEREATRLVQEANAQVVALRAQSGAAAGGAGGVGAGPAAPFDRPVPDVHGYDPRRDDAG